MALTTTQVNQAFLATLGRPAEGSAATWGSTSLSLGALSDSIFIAENTEDFVESLYTEILGRASDAEGKAFWNSLLATTSKEAVLAQFKAAVIAAGQADPSNADYQSFIAQNKAFVATLYANLLGRDDAKTADAEGIDFWANALATGMSRGDLISAFVSAALSDPNSDDAQTLNAKLSVADAYSAAFKDFGKDVTADEKKAAYAQLVEQMKEVVAGSTVEEFQDAINQFKGQNQDRKTDVFTKAEDDDLDASESTAATTFRGTINISDDKKSTIQAGDAATGNSDFAAANTLIVDVKSDGKEKDFNFVRDMKATINNVDNLTINNGTADVTLNLAGGDNYTGKVAITGKGDRANVTVDQEVASLNVSTSGAKKAYTDVTVNNGSTLGSFEGSAAVDTLKIDGIIAKSINTGDGADSVTLDTNAEVYEKATINLGSGADEIIINTGNIGLKDANGDAITKVVPSVTIDGGNGKDTLTLRNDISQGVKSIVNIENIKATGTAAISAVAADGLKTTVSGDLTINASYDNIKSIDLRGIKSEKTTDGKKDTGFLTLSDVTYENITLSSNIEETIVFKSHDAEETSYAEISKFASGDKIRVLGGNLKKAELDGKKVNLTRANDEVKAAIDAAGGNVVAINDTNGKASYIWEKVGVDNYKLVSIVDKKLKVEAGSFVYDNSKGGDEPTITVQSLKYVDTASGAVIDLKATDGKGTYDVGGGNKPFNAPLGDNDMLVISSVTSASQGLKVSDTGSKSTGTVAAIVTGKVGNIVKDDAAATAFNGTLDVYLGGYLENDKIAAGLSNVGAASSEIAAASIKGADNIYANTTGTIYLDNAANLDGKKIDLSIVKASIDLTNTAITATKNAVDINNYVIADNNDYVAAKIANVTAATTITGTKGADKIELGTIKKAQTIDLGNSTGDFLDIKAAKTTDATADDMIIVSGLAEKGVAAIQLIAASNNLAIKNAVDSDASGKTLVAALNAGIAAAGATTAKDVAIVKVHGSTKAEEDGLYVIVNNDSDSAISTGDVLVKLVGVVSNIGAYNDGSNVVGITIA